MYYKYTDKELEHILKSIIILIDSREKSNKHIIDWFDKNKVKYKDRVTLNYGDYSFFIPENKELSIDRDIHFDNKVVIERKNSLEELSGNFTKNRDRFENELLRKKNAKFTLMIEQKEFIRKFYDKNRHEISVYNKDGNELVIKDYIGSIHDIIESKYTTDYNNKAYLATLLSFSNRYKFDTIFIKKSFSALIIYYNFYYYLRNYFKYGIV